jgi:co-chaperonin GroES (HSP10)
MYKFTPTPNVLIIKFKNQFKDEDKHGLRVDTTYNPEHHIRTSAEVVGVPSRFESGTLAHKYPGSPPPRSYSSKSKMTSLYYHSHTFYTAADCDIDIRVGDIIYFHYLAIQYEQFGRASQTYLNRDDEGYEYHQIQVDNLMAVIRDGALIPLLGRVFAKPVEESDLNKHGFKLMKGNKLLQGKVTHVGSPIGDQDADISVGDEVVYLKHAEFENEFEGEQFYVMKHWFIVAKMVDGVYQPVGDYVKLEKKKEDGHFVMEASTNPFQKNAEVLMVGEKSDKSLINSTVVFNNRSSYFAQLDENTIFVRKGDVYFINNKNDYT